MKIDEVINEFSDQFKEGHLKERVDKYMPFFPEEIVGTIPSVELNPTGMQLKSIFLLSDKFIAELRIDPEEEEFDISPRTPIFNFRIRRSEVEGSAANGEKIVHKVTEVVIAHTVEGFLSRLSYIGDNQDEWMENVKSLFPYALMV